MRRTVAAVALAGLSVASPASAAGLTSAGPDRAPVTVEEYVCYPSHGDVIRIGRGWAITLPSGRVILICTTLPL